MIIEYNKNIGETMTQVINRFRFEYNIDSNIKVAFAGRLDPLAQGSIILLTDNDIYKKDNYCKRNKIYECMIVEGITTDTFDIMGLIQKTNLEFNNMYKDTNNLDIKMIYPPYSSSTVIDIDNKKRQSWYCMKNNIQIKTDMLPTKDIHLYYAKKLEEYTITNNDLYNIIENRINRVSKETFRQKEILEEWSKIILEKITISKWLFKVSSGGYIRYFANEMKGCAYDINRLEYSD